MPDIAATWDYRCPFARNLHEHLVAALQAGAAWDVRFLPFSLDQVHVEEGQPDVWEAPTPAVLALEVGVVVRDCFAKSFPAVHVALFAARHDDSRDLREEAVLRQVLGRNGIDAGAVFGHIGDGWPLELVRRDHEAAVRDHQVFGVPTVIADGRAAFVRLLDRPEGDPDLAARTVERVVGLVRAWPELNELKHTTVSQ